MASAHGACTCAPYGLCSTSRQSPELVAEPLHHQRAVVGQVAGGLPLARSGSGSGSAPPARPVRPYAAARRPPPGPPRRVRGRTRRAPGPAPRGGPACPRARTAACPAGPGAGETSTWSAVMSSIRQELAPSTNTSPTRDSYTISSSSSPTRCEFRPCRAAAPARNTPNRPRSGMVPPLVTASRWRARPAAQRAGRAVPDQPGPQLRELLARVAARQHVQHRVEHAAW